ncbi:MAG: hypothetical protein IPJ51_12710 [Saprospiraceae bacterium]|nr:hypothetical protein [Saprospiraceae bacterium]
MNAILWDGNKQLHGFIEFTENELVFRLKDFSDTSLHLEIAYLDIVHVRNHKMYGISHEGIEIVSKDGKRDVFVVEGVEIVKQNLNRKMA